MAKPRNTYRKDCPRKVSAPYREARASIPCPGGYNRTYVQNLNIGPQTCHYCFKLTGRFTKEHEEVCKRDKETVTGLEFFDDERKAPMMKRGKSDRKCKRCGRDPWPNYFFCKSCLPPESY
jgi:hypothetical protein